MTKRALNCEVKNAKKQKLDEDIDALWGDDLDDSILDDCLTRATQVLIEDKDKLNSSILPSYNAFKQPMQIFSSTQIDLTIRPGTSKSIPSTNKDNVVLNYEQEIRRLQQQCEEKTGEISILRNQLLEMKTHSNFEIHKSQNEWKSKMSVKEKQIHSMKSELEFKNLEIANLKNQKIVDITKHSLNVTLNSSKFKTNKQDQTVIETVQKQCNREKSKLHASVDSVYPLKRLVSKIVFNVPKIEKHVIENKLIRSSRNAIPYLKNQTVSTSVVVEKSRADIDIIHPIILELAQCTNEELNMRENITRINKIVCVSLQLLADLQELLKQIKANLGTEDILEADSIYLKKKFSDATCLSLARDEMGMKSGIVINFLAELLLYCDYFKRYIFGDKLSLTEQDSLANKYEYLATKRIHTGVAFLNKVIDIAKIIGEIRKAEVMPTFLQSSVKLFTNICKLKKSECVSDSLCRFTKELIFLRPPPNIILEITYLFKEASQSTPFIEFLLNKSKSCSTTKKGVVYFNNEACRFYIFVLLFDRCLYNLKTIPLDVTLNLLCFMYNTYKTSFFVHHQDTKECDCLPQLYKLEIDVVFRALEQYTEEVKKTKIRSSEWHNFFSNKITAKILSLMAFHSYELTEKYITVYSQFKEIERQLQEEDLMDLDRLNIHEEIPEIDSSNFENINFD